MEEWLIRVLSSEDAETSEAADKRGVADPSAVVRRVLIEGYRSATDDLRYIADVVRRCNIQKDSYGTTSRG